MHPIPVEICIDCGTVDRVAQDVCAAAEGGAARVELCANVAAGGVTPAPGLVAAARRAAPPSLQILVMIRPRPGDFHVSQDELATMIRAIEDSADAGADGVVFGATLRDSAGSDSSEIELAEFDRSSIDVAKIDLVTTRQLAETAANLGLKTTFHRAFDTLANPAASLHQLIDLGMGRVLTAGTPWKSGKPAVEGIDQLVSLGQQAMGQMEIVVGGGVDPASALRLTDAMSLHTRHFSLHAYSSAHRNGRVSSQKVADLVRACRLLGARKGR